MSDEVTVWLVERTYTDKGLVEIIYAPEGGDRMLVEQRSSNRAGDVTAARTVAPAKLEPVDDEATRERYATEVGRMVERYDPDDPV